MKRKVSSTSTEDERRKPLMEAYMFQRRILLGCSFLIGLALLIWIIAIATDHWIIISTDEGIFVPESRRFFVSSHSGIWRACRYTTVAQALPNAKVVRNFTTIAYQSQTLSSSVRKGLGKSDFIKKYLAHKIPDPLVNFTEAEEKAMFASWVVLDTKKFEFLRDKFKTLVADVSYPQRKAKTSVTIVATDVALAREKLGSAFITVPINETEYNFAMPEVIQSAVFNDWNSKPALPKLLWPYARDLHLSPVVVNKNNESLFLIPPTPPERGNIQANGFDYKYNQHCKYINMFPDDNDLQEDLAFDDEVMDYIRTQASFAVITIFIMTLGCVFSFYTFTNPRYMFKRLAGGIHLISSATCIVVIQVMIASVNYQKDNLSYAYPKGAKLSYGYGVYLGWLVFGSNLITGLLFLWYSGKKKGAKAPTDELAMADEAVAMGR